MPYLIFTSKEAAIERADEEGKDNNFSHWTKGKGTRWLTFPVPTIDGLWALDVTAYDLDAGEDSATIDAYIPMPDED